MNSSEAPVITAPSASRERLELETRVLAAALRQSLELGDQDGSALAHEQIFLLIKACQELNSQEPQMAPRELFIDKGRQLPDIDWGSVLDEVSLPAASIDASDGSVESVTENNDLAGAKLTESPDFTKNPHNGGNMEGVTASSGDVKESPAAENLNVQAKPQVQLEEVGADRSFKVIEKDTASGLVHKPSESDGTVDLYGRLSVSESADSRSVHLCFLRKVRSLLRAEELFKGPERRKTLALLQSIWIAHDILSDPVTRGDYDLRRRGDSEDEEKEEYVPLRKRVPLMRIGELLECTGLLEKTELEIAADMHKAMPEMMFGAFLVKQGFIAEDDLRCVLVGQALIKDEVLTLSQFQQVMEVRASSGKDIGSCLKSQGIATDEDLRRIVEEDGPLKILCQMSGISLLKSDVGIITAEDLEVVEPRAKEPTSRSLNLGAAAPAWKDQLDWGLADDQESEPEQDEDEVESFVQDDQSVAVPDEDSTGEEESIIQSITETQSEVGVSTAETPALTTAVAHVLKEPELLPVDQAVDAADAQGEKALDSEEPSRPTTTGSFFEDEEAVRRKPKSSLIDLMVDFGSVKPAEEEGGDALLKFVEHQEQVAAGSGLAEQEITAPVSQEDFSPPENADLEPELELEPKLELELEPEQVEGQSFPFDGKEQSELVNLAELATLSDLDELDEPSADFFDEVSQLSSAVDAILDLPDPESSSIETNSAEISSAEPGKEGQSSQFVETSDSIDALPHSLTSDSAKNLSTSKGPVETSTQIPAMTPELLAKQARAQSAQQAQDWSIVSLPASHLASFLLDDEPPSQPGQPRKKDKSDDDKKNQKRRR